MADKDSEEPPFEAGSQPIPNRADPVPGGGRGAAQTIVLIVAALAILAALIWFFVPFG